LGSVSEKLGIIQGQGASDRRVLKGVFPNVEQKGFGHHLANTKRTWSFP